MREARVRLAGLQSDDFHSFGGQDGEPSLTPRLVRSNAAETYKSNLTSGLL
jgi:hypothetical protein